MKARFIIYVILLILLFFTPFAGSAQHSGKARLKGIVKAEDGSPLAGVRVKLYSRRASSKMETNTNVNGEWKAMWIRGGTWDLDFDKTGYQSKRFSTHLQEDSKVVEIETVLIQVKGPAIKQDMLGEFDKGNKLFDAGKWDEALAIYENIVAKFPESYSIYLNIGNCYFEKQLYEKAISAYQKLLDKEADNTDVILSVGNSFSNLNQTATALKWYAKVQVEKINDPVVLYNIGVFNFNAGKSDEALRFFRRSVEVKEDFADGWYQLAMTQMGAGNNSEAVTLFETYLKLDPDSEKAATVQEILKALKQ